MNPNARCWCAGLLTLAGCTLTTREQKLPKMFADNLATLTARYDQIAVGVTTWSAIERIGFSFRDSNAIIRPGAEAIKVVFGENAFQGSITSPEKIDALLREANPFKLVVIPHKDITVLSDRFYFSEKESFRTGHDVRFVLVFKDDLVVYKARESQFFDEYALRKAFGQGIVDLLTFTREATDFPNPKTPDALK